MKKTFKRVVSLVLAAAVAASGITAPKKAEAASKYNCYLMWASADWKCQNMQKNVANTSVKNKKGSANYTVTLTRAKAQGEHDGDKATASKEACVFCVDIEGILKDYKEKNVKISNVVVKCDGKVVKTDFKKMAQGALEKNSSPEKYRLEIYNIYGEGGTKDHPCAKPTAFKWKKSISVSFKLTLK